LWSVPNAAPLARSNADPDRRIAAAGTSVVTKFEELGSARHVLLWFVSRRRARLRAIKTDGAGRHEGAVVAPAAASGRVCGSAAESTLDDQNGAHDERHYGSFEKHARPLPGLTFAGVRVRCGEFCVVAHIVGPTPRVISIRRS